MKSSIDAIAASIGRLLRDFDAALLALDNDVDDELNAAPSSACANGLVPLAFAHESNTSLHAGY